MVSAALPVADDGSLSFNACESALIHAATSVAGRTKTAMLYVSVARKRSKGSVARRTKAAMLYEGEKEKGLHEYQMSIQQQQTKQQKNINDGIGECVKGVLRAGMKLEHDGIIQKDGIEQKGAK